MNQVTIPAWLVSVFVSALTSVVPFIMAFTRLRVEVEGLRAACNKAHKRIDELEDVRVELEKAVSALQADRWRENTPVEIPREGTRRYRVRREDDSTPNE
jgi:hypothetical protein